MPPFHIGRQAETNAGWACNNWWTNFCFYFYPIFLGILSLAHVLQHPLQRSMDDRAISVHVQEAAQQDRGSQRCRLPPQVINSLGIQHGDLVAVATAASEIWLCRGVVDATCAWSRQPPSVPIVCPDKLVQLAHESAEHDEYSDNIPLLWPIGATAAPATACFVQSSLPKSAMQLLCGMTVAQGCTVHSGGGTLTIQSVFPNQDGLSVITPSTRMVLLEGGGARGSLRTKAPAPHLPVSLAGLEQAIQEIRRSILSPLESLSASRHLRIQLPCGLLLVGSHASGVQELPQVLASLGNADTASTPGPHLHVTIKELQPGASNAAALLAEVVGNLQAAASCGAAAGEEAPPSLTLVVLKDVHRFTQSRSDTQQSQAAASSALLAQMDALSDASKRSSDRRAVVLGMTDKPESMDPAFRRPGRFEREVILGALTTQQRVALLGDLLPRGAGPHAQQQRQAVSALAASLSGYQRNDLTMLARAAMAKALQKAPSNYGHRAFVGMPELSFACKCFPASGVDSFRSSPRSLTWASIGGYTDVKQQLERALVWPLQHADAFTRLGISPPSGVLLFGPPGCAKTSLVHAAANESKVAFFSLSGADVTSAYVGESERTLRKVFKLARASRPSLVFIDEAEALVGTRGGGGLSSGILTTLLTEMDGVHDCSGVMVVASTNLPHMLDAALLRPGRLESRVLVGPPDAHARKAIFELYTRGKGMRLHEAVDMAVLVDATQWYTGAEIEGVCREAGMAAVRRRVAAAAAADAAAASAQDSTFELSVSQSDFIAAIGKVKTICGSTRAASSNPMASLLKELRRFASQEGAGVQAMVQ